MSGLNVLFIEDNDDDIAYFQEMMGSSSETPIRLKLARDLSRGLERLREDIDVVLLDLYLPDSKGLQTFDRIKEHSPNQPIVIITGKEDERDAIKAVQAGAQDYVSKSNVDANLLVRSLRYAVERQRMVVELEKRVAERTAELRAANDLLKEEIAERKKLERQVLQISEQEQRRIGQDLHDGLTQHLTGIRFHSQHLKEKVEPKSDLAATADRINKLLTEAIEQARHTVHGLNPVRLEHEGLAEALKEMLADTSFIFRIDCRFDAPRSFPDLDKGSATHLFRIAQEAVHNAIRHGEAKKIFVKLSHTKGRVTLLVEDNGKGLQAQAGDPKGMGLTNMKYRAETMGGSLEINAAKTGGVKVTCIMPSGGYR